MAKIIHKNSYKLFIPFHLKCKFIRLKSLVDISLAEFYGLFPSLESEWSVTDQQNATKWLESTYSKRKKVVLIWIGKYTKKRLQLLIWFVYEVGDLILCKQHNPITNKSNLILWLQVFA